jgi:hypothetical protein
MADEARLDEFTWTKPRYGVEHLQQAFPGIRQVTLERHGSSFEVWILGMVGFTPFWRATCTSADSAKRKALAQLRVLNPADKRFKKQVRGRPAK